MELTVLDQARGFCAEIDQSPCNGCDACGTRCTAGIRILQAEFEAIRAWLSAQPPEETRRVREQEKRVFVPGTEYPYVACRFRDVERGRCSIYPVRPTVCRLFGHVEWLPCPIGKVERTVPRAVPLMQAYGREELRTYEEWLGD